MLALIAILLSQTPQHRLFPQPNLPRQSGERYPTPPPIPAPPNNAFYFAPSGGFGVGSGPCRGQVMVDASQNTVLYSRSAGVSGDGGAALATCIRESDGLGVELVGGEPIVQTFPSSPDVIGPLVESASANFLRSTDNLASAQWTATATVTADAWTGPFSHYRTAGGFESINDTSGVASQSVCQTYTSGSTVQYAFSCWLRSGTLTSARLSITGTGNAAGDRTCTITGLDSTLSRSDRKGCVTTAAYAGGVTAVTACVLPGSVAGDQGTVGAVDCQLEKLDHVTSYIPNPWTGGNSTRLIASATVPTAPATLTLSDTAGCSATDMYAQKYDAETFWSVITVGRNGSRGPYYSSDTAARAFDGTNAPNMTRSSLWNSTASARAMWAADGGLSIYVFDAGYNTTAYDGTMFGGSITADTLALESANGSQDAIIANVRLDLTDNACTYTTMANVTRVGWMGDSISARTDPDPINPPTGFFQREGVNGTNFSVVGAKFDTDANNCTTQWRTGGNGTYDTIVVWCGVNDLLVGTLGASLFASELAWVREWAYRGINVYWLDIAPFGTYDTDGGTWGERVAFNSLQAAYCAAPETNIHCVTMSPTLADPTNSNILYAPYSFDGIHLTQAGATAASVRMASQYP